MVPGKQDHGRKHQGRVDDIQIHLMTDQIPIFALCILNEPENTPDQDQHARRVEDKKVFLPGQPLAVENFAGRDLEHAAAEYQADNEEEREEEDLYSQARENDLLTRLYRIL